MFNHHWVRFSELPQTSQTVQKQSPAQHQEDNYTHKYVQNMDGYQIVTCNHCKQGLRRYFTLL